MSTATPSGRILPPRSFLLVGYAHPKSSRGITAPRGTDAQQREYAQQRWNELRADHARSILDAEITALFAASR